MQLTDRRYFGLLGEIVDGNPTQEMVQAGFAAAGLPWTYVSMAIPRDGFTAAWAAARTLGFAGLNVTKPFKLQAAAARGPAHPGGGGHRRRQLRLPRWGC